MANLLQRLIELRDAHSEDSDNEPCASCGDGGVDRWGYSCDCEAHSKQPGWCAECADSGTIVPFPCAERIIFQGGIDFANDVFRVLLFFGDDYEERLRPLWDAYKSITGIGEWDHKLQEWRPSKKHIIRAHEYMEDCWNEVCNCPDAE